MPRASDLLRSTRLDDLASGERALLGLPYDGGIPTRPGARFGPAAIRAALGSLTTFDGSAHVPEVRDCGDLALPTMNGGEAHRLVEEEAARLFTLGARPVFLGGDHGLTGSLIRGLAAARTDIRLAVVNIDAHLDVREYTDASSLSSGTPFRRAAETDIVDGSRMATVGVRRFANSAEHLGWAREQGMHLVSAEEVAEEGAAAVAANVLDWVMEDADALYLSVDIDAVDAAFAPGASAAGPEGLTAREAIGLVRRFAADDRLVAADIMEVSPPYDQDGRTARLAARILLEALAA